MKSSALQPIQGGVNVVRSRHRCNSSSSAASVNSSSEKTVKASNRDVTSTKKKMQVGSILSARQRVILDGVCDTLSTSQMTRLYYCLILLQSLAGDQGSRDARSLILSGLKIELLSVQESSQIPVQPHAAYVELCIAMLEDSPANEIGEMHQMIHPRVLIVLQHTRQANRMDYEINCQDALQGSVLSSPNGSDGASDYSENSDNLRVVHE